MPNDPPQTPSGEALPCPWCGAEATRSRRLDESLWSPIVWWASIGCGDCDVQLTVCDDPEGAQVLALWNRRAASRPTPSATVEHLRDQVIGLSSCVKNHGEPCDLCEEAVDALVAAATAQGRAEEGEKVRVAMGHAKVAQDALVGVRAATLAEVRTVVEGMRHSVSEYETGCPCSACYVVRRILVALDALRDLSDISQEPRAVGIDAPQVSPPAIAHDADTGIRDLDPLAVEGAGD